MRNWIFIVAMALAGCSPAAEKAEKRYAFLEGSNASDAELCRAAIEARDAFAHDENKDRYEHWSSMAVAKCSR